MSFNPSMEEIKKEAKCFVDANIWDGEDRYWGDNDSATFTPGDLQDLIDELLDHLSDRRFI